MSSVGSQPSRWLCLPRTMIRSHHPSGFMKTMILCNHRAFARVERSRPCYATYPTPGSTRSLPIVLPRYMDLNVVPFCQSASQQPQSTNGGMVVFNVVRLFALSEAISTSPPQCQHHSTSFFIQRSHLCQSSSQYLQINIPSARIYCGYSVEVVEETVVMLLVSSALKKPTRSRRKLRNNVEILERADIILAIVVMQI